MKRTLIFLAGLLASTGCAVATDPTDSLEQAGTCEPGEVFECYCVSGSASTQVCAEDGASVFPCECGDSAGGGAAPPVTSTGGNPPITATGGSAAVGGTGGSVPGGAGGTGGVIAGGTGGVESGTGGLPPAGGTGGLPPAGGTGGEPLPPAGGTGGEPIGSGTCCPTGDCLCHGPDPSGLTSLDGPYNTATFPIQAGTVHYPTDAEPPFAGVAVCGGFTNTGPEMTAWGAFYASHGIVTVITSTLGSDIPAVRATKLLGAIEGLKGENTNPSSPLSGLMAGRYGTSGYSMGGGGTTIASGQDPSLMTSVGLAAWGPDASGVQVPTLLLCGANDGVAPCSMSDGAYRALPGTTPKMMVTIPSTTHFDWFGPRNAGGGVSGETALAFQKVFLEGDERWRPLLMQSGGTVVTNIQ